MPSTKSMELMEAIDFLDLNERMDEIEKKIGKIPSKMFFITLSALNLIFLSIIILFQATILSFINEVLPRLRNFL